MHSHDVAMLAFKQYLDLNQEVFQFFLLFNLDEFGRGVNTGGSILGLWGLLAKH